MPLPIWCVVINQKIVGVSSRLRQALHGLLIRLWNRAERHGLPTATHPNEYSSDVQSRVFCGDKQNLCCIACLSRAIQQFRVDGQILDDERASLAQHHIPLLRNRWNQRRKSFFQVGIVEGSLARTYGACYHNECWFRFAQNDSSLSCGPGVHRIQGFAAELSSDQGHQESFP